MYPSKSVAGLFTGSFREEQPIHSGQPCCVCAESDGTLKRIGYDEVLGELWIHEHCEAHVREELKREVEKLEQNAFMEAITKWQR